jgi:hypothetical protein
MKATLRFAVCVLLGLLPALHSSAQFGGGGAGGLNGPTSKMLSPANGAVFEAPVNIKLEAFVTPHGSTFATTTVKSAEFFANAQPLGFGSLGFCVCDIAIAGGGRPLAPSDFIWTNAPPGSYQITCKATDASGISVISAPIMIIVNPIPPPPPNITPIVGIVASDPVAIATTNCWTWVGLSNLPPVWSNWVASNAIFNTFTNCGPKDAMFTVHRFGPTNNDLTIPYTIGGTALNGADYTQLPGFVTISAGQSSTFIVVEPIDTGATNYLKTVVLSLQSSSNTPPLYVTGIQTNAAAIIIDRPGERRPTGMLPGRCFHLFATGPDAAWFHIEFSTNLLDWTPICTNQLVDGAIDFVDPTAFNDIHRYYRAVPELNAPQ